MSTTIRRTLRRIRLDLGLTQRQLAERVGIDATTVSDYEHGKMVPSILRAREIADALGVGLDAIDFETSVA
jgi:transcriptional regulator with XRE-family HTH domain